MVARAQKGLRLVVVAARYNPDLVDGLLRHTLGVLRQAGLRDVEAIRVPGSYEIPAVAMRLARSRKYHAIIALGVVLQGRTAHADHIATACAIHLQQIALETGVPVIHQVLSPRNRRDARVRLRLRGEEAAHSAIAMAELMRTLKFR